MENKNDRKIKGDKLNQPNLRSDGRLSCDLRPIKIFVNYLDFASGSALIEMGRTKVLVAASIEEKVPPFLKGTGSGWVTAEYAMLPCSTEIRTPRERTQGRISGRSQEIQRLIGRALRAAVDLKALGERQILLDCDVIQADGGTRTASITAGCVALALALKKLVDENKVSQFPLTNLVAGISVGLINGQLYLDLDYHEDSQAEVDMNIVETDSGQLVEIQATGERRSFTRKELAAMLRLAHEGLQSIFEIQRTVLKKKSPFFHILDKKIKK
ncbi:MAG: ribonuclease PH [Candidatus Aminicenantes bacterium]|nr:ribonuclease PH [Candidatus Aminicenantes bacterium]